MANENALVMLNLLQNSTEATADLQITALEQLCLLILQTESSENLKKEFPPSSFIPVLIKLFTEFETPPAVLESAARVLTYYAQILPLDCSANLFENEGSICAICIRLESSDLSEQVENDLAQQIIKLLEELLHRDSNITKIAKSISSIFEFVSTSWKSVHVDTVRSGLFVVSRLANALDLWMQEELSARGTNWKSSGPTTSLVTSLQKWIAGFIQLISHRDLQVSCGGLDCLHAIFCACNRLPHSWSLLERLTSKSNLVDRFLSLLSPPSNKMQKKEVKPTRELDLKDREDETTFIESRSGGMEKDTTYLTGHLAMVVVDLLLKLCQGQPNILSAVAQSPSLSRLFQHALDALTENYRSKEANAPNTTTQTGYTDVLLPTLHLSEGLLSLAMTLPYEPLNIRSSEPLVTSFDKEGWENRESKPEFLKPMAVNVKSTNRCTPEEEKARSVWRTCLSARLFSPKQADQISGYVRCGLPCLPSFTSSSSGNSMNSTGNPQISQTLFLAARQGFEHLGIADDYKLASERFHHWLTNSIANRTNMADLLSILQCGQINGYWMDSVGQPLLSWSIASGHGAATVALCNRGADVNTGLTGCAIHYATTFGQLECARSLLGLGGEHGGPLTETSVANPRIRDCYGRTPAQLAVKALEAAVERASPAVDKYKDLVKLLREAEARFKQEVNTSLSSPLAKLLSLAIPVLTEIYINTAQPEIRIRVLQILARSIRCRTGFIVMYQMQIPQKQESDEANREADKSHGQALTEHFVQMLVHALSQGSSEEVLLVLTMITALIDQPFFPKWMHRYGIPDLLLWRAKICEQEQQDRIKKCGRKSKTEKQQRELAKPSGRFNLRETVPMCIPSYIKKPALISLEPKEVHPYFQCIHELGYWQAYSFGDWYLIRPRSNSLLMFHDFAALWLDVTANENLASSTWTQSVLNAFLLTRLDKGNRSENVQLPLLPTGQNSSALPTTENLGPENTQSSSLPISLSNEILDNLSVHQLKCDSSPVDRTEIAEELWHTVLPIIVQVRQMFYGMLPLPLFKTASPLRSTVSDHYQEKKSPLGSGLQFASITKSKVSIGCQPPETEGPSSVMPGCLISQINATASSTDPHLAEDHKCSGFTGIPQVSDISKPVEFSSNFLDVANKIAEPPKINTSEQSTWENGPESSAVIVSVNPPTSSENHTEEILNDAFKEAPGEPSLQQDLLVNNVDVDNTAETTLSATEVSSRSPETLQAGQPSRACHSEKYSLNGSKKLVKLYVGSICISLSPQGLWLTFIPTLSLNSKFSSVGEFLDTDWCGHPECRSQWNPDFNISTCYNEQLPEITSVSTYFNQTVTILKKGLQRTCAGDLQKLSKGIGCFSDLSETGEQCEEGKAAMKILCHPTRLGGIRVCDALDKIIYQSGPITRSSGHLRLTRFLENLSFTQRQFVRNKHREARLRCTHDTITRVATILANLLKQIIARKQNSRPRSASSKQDGLLNPTTSTLDPVRLSDFTSWFFQSPYNSESNQRPKIAEIVQFLRSFDQSTPFEIVQSQLIPHMRTWFKEKLARTYQSERLTQMLPEFSGTEGSLLESVVLSVPVLLRIFRKLIAAVELIERYPMPLTQFVVTPDQLLTRTIQLRPQALAVDTEAVSFRSEYRRKVDLSNYHLYAQPLVTVRQLQDWVANTIRKIPWYKDDVRHTGFTYDMQQSRYGVHLLPPTVDPATVGTLGRKFLGGVFKWYGTNGGRQIKWANPLRLHGLVRVVTSDIDLNQDPHTVGRLLANPVLEQRQISRKTLGSKKPKHQTTSHTSIRQHAVLIRPDREGAFPNESASWIVFDLGLYIHLTHYLIQVPLLGDRWPHLTDWQVQGSTSGILWEVLSEHHVNPAGDPKAYWGPRGEKTWCLQTSQTETGVERGWRFIRIQALPGCGQNKRLQSSMALRGIEFFGIVTKLYTTQDKFAQTEATKYLRRFRTGAFVVPNLPAAICDDIFSDRQQKNKCDRWQPLEENAPMEVRFSDDYAPRHHVSRGQPPIIGKLLDDLKDGYVTVRWLSDPDEMCEASEYKSVAKSYCMGAFNRYELRLPSDVEIQSRLQILYQQKPKASTTLDFGETKHISDAFQSKDTPVKGMSKKVDQNIVLASVPHTVTSYLLPMTQNWLAEALLPTFSRVVPFLFASCTPKLLREPPVTRHRSSSPLMTAASAVSPSLEHKENSQTMTSRWEDAGSLAVEDVLTGRGLHSQSDMSEAVNDEASFPEKFTFNVENKLSMEPEYKEHPNCGSSSGNLLKSFPSPSQPTLPVSATESQLNHDGFVDLEGAPSCHLSACTDAYITVLPASAEMAIDSDDAEDGGVNEEVNDVDVEEYENDANELNEDLSRSLGFESTKIQEANVAGPETHYDEELDAIDNALELQILKNIEENGFVIETHGSLCGPSKIPKHHGYRKSLKFDDYENRDPICISSLVQQCMNIDILGSEKCKQVIPLQRATQSQQAAEDNQPSCSAYTRMDITTNQSKLLPPHFYNETSFSASGAENSEQAAPTVLYQKTAEVDQQNPVIPSEKCHSSLPSSRPALENVRAPTNKPLASIHPSAPKQLTRLQPSDGIRVENIESSLNGLIPPFETRTGNSHLPSITTFTIPMRVQWPPDGLSTNESSSLRVNSAGKSKTSICLRLRQEESTDPLGGFFCSVVTLTSSGSSSISNTPQKTCESVSSNLENDHATSSTRNMGPEDIQLSENIPDAYNLNNPDVHLVHYLLKYADHVEDFPGSGVLRGPGTHLAKLWNRTYLLDYHLDDISEDQLRDANQLSRMVPVRKSAQICESGLAPQVFVDPSSLEQLLDLLAAIHEYLNLTSSQGERSRRDRFQAVCQSSCPIVKAASLRGQSEPDDSVGTEVTAFLEGMQFKGSVDVDPSVFISSRLTRKLTSYSRDVWSVLANIHTLNSPLESDGTSNKFKWITRLTTDYKFLFPFEARLEFWRVSSLGTSRAIAWLQKRTGNSRVSNNHLLGVGVASFLQRADATTHHSRDRGGKILTPDANFSWTPSVVIVPNPVTSQNSQIENDPHLNQRFSEPTNSVGFGIPPPPNLFGTPSGGVASSLVFGLSSRPPLAGLGRLQRHMARVPRPQQGTTLSDPNHESADDNNVEQILICGTTYSFFSGGNNFWAAAVRLLLAHADMRQELEVEFEGEEGTGLGPTMEFYALLSAELRRHSHGLWVSEDRNEEPSMFDYDQKIEEAKLSFDSKMDLIKHSEDGNVDFYQKESVEETHAAIRSIKEDGDFYVNPAMGLFPAPWPEDQLPPGVELRFYVLGIAVAKCLLDQRQMDLPFSNAFLTLLCQFNARLMFEPKTDQARKEWPGDVLDLNNFVDIYPERGKFLKTLISYIQERRLLSNQLTPEEFEAADLDIQRRLFSTELEALCITMSFAPATRKFGQTEFQLTSAYDPTFLKNADDIPTFEEFLTAATAEQFIRRSVEFAMHKGIRKQMCAFRAGFERVLPLASLATFTPHELGRLIFGESCPEWTPQEIWTNCEPAAGYTRQSSGFRMFIESVSSFDVSERRAFLRFVTGCPTLPPGGLRNLHPKLKVSR
ncbi:hypothetical protein CRM22_009836 [Opisthorchis felineus]|uniref:E3 ubiquitin-protein ligase n=1 Tax=Opisthorchis felineus TaxID=147828 RepID=A0A4S2L4U1_OPIFE|nr:hypothetical protein CRM22_009836 [Opisthorchis felineus]